ncbi:MAG: nucleotide exchange factor GrpE [Alicyclobacillaceae bacterium]|nr:nucleotide exchange factor GrpE [Alicyclobacillaceae bacterium]
MVNEWTEPSFHDGDGFDGSASSMDTDTSSLGEEQSEDKTEMDIAEESAPEPSSLDEGTTKLAEELEVTKQQLIRTLADFDNFRRRARQEKEDLVKSAARSVLLELLPIADNFDRAVSSLSVEGVSEQLVTGIGMVQRQLQALLEKQGVERMNVVGETFNPEYHDAVLQEAASDEHPAGTVVDVLQAGYMLNGKVLRPAMVKVTV